jgi:hypothetical protein
MAIFTPQEASGTTISKCEAKFSDSGMTNHLYYIFAVNDEDGITYDWKDKELEAGADQETIKLAIYDHLVASVTKRYPSTESQMSDEGIIGSNPG